MRQLSIIGTVGVPACYGGFESLVENLLDYIPDTIQTRVYCSGKVYKNRLKNYKNAELKYLPLSANGISSVLYDVISIYLSRRSEILLVLGVSGCIFLPILRPFIKGKIITNIDGIEWKRKKWNGFAKKILHLSENFAVRYSDIAIGDNKGIVDYIREEYCYSAELIEYGADHVSYIDKTPFLNTYSFLKYQYAVSVCRIEPENNIDIILDAFENVKSIKLVIVGNWENSDYGIEIRNKYIGNENIYLLNPIYDIERINMIRSNGMIYIHGHSAGGTNPSLVEAMNAHLPVFAYDCIYNRETTEEKAFYWSNSIELRELITNLPNYEENKKNMKEIAQRRYSWSRISEKYIQLIE